MQFTDLEKNILRTVSYFNLFKLPLSSWEIYTNLYNHPNSTTFEDIEKTLNKLVEIKTLEFKEGFYFFPNGRDLVQIRKQRYLIAQKKVKIARRYIRLFSKIPFIKAVFICNNLAYLNSQVESDIDLAIITTPGRIWTARFFSAGLMKILRRRPTNKTQKNRICLSFFLTEKSLNLSQVAYPEDIHFTYWVNQFMPIYDEQDLADKFYEANNWTKTALPNLAPIKTNKRWRITNKTQVKKFFENLMSSRIGNVIEKFLKSVQLQIMPTRLKTIAQESNTNVIIRDEILKFHDRDKRLEIKTVWEKTLQI